VNCGSVPFQRSIALFWMWVAPGSGAGETDDTTRCQIREQRREIERLKRQKAEVEGDRGSLSIPPPGGTGTPGTTCYPAFS